jgi:hypothetical protein
MASLEYTSTSLFGRLFGLAKCFIPLGFGEILFEVARDSSGRPSGLNGGRGRDAPDNRFLAFLGITKIWIGFNERLSLAHVEDIPQIKKPAIIKA